ncbi:FRG1-like family-domain-containing protein [Exophiala viscosa]|uniref:FRG1-like family-domain-containing protein n=1 Tax=Exophiala viscosa TaxID=2486360 RepID=A0AAN6DPD6_9EURO|nr:FRG1-like family-domain-containing protein [Exophiala viscosa]KAI1620935.1 FRG1-like family-domain-containing protein [Exophiala viscosa]
MPVKPLMFKGDKKPKKRKHRTDDERNSKALVHSDNVDQSTEDDIWTTADQPSDLSGPTILVLPTAPPTCLAADAHGNVFASPIENIVESHAETAEPHDVRQVWVTSSVAGTAGMINLKGSHGGFLSCDSLGVLGARREARGPEEGFVVEAFESEGRQRWRLRTSASKPDERRYLSATVTGSATAKHDEDDEESDTRKQVSVSLRGDGEADDPSTHIIIKMQAQFKPTVQQNKETKAKEKVSRHELERVIGRSLDDDEVRRLKRAKKDGTYHEEVLDVRVKGKHDKFASS